MCNSRVIYCAYSSEIQSLICFLCNANYIFVNVGCMIIQYSLKNWKRWTILEWSIVMYAVMVYIEQYYITKVSQKHALCILGVHKWPCLDHKSRVSYCHRRIPVLVQKFFNIKVLWRSSLKCADNFDAFTRNAFFMRYILGLNDWAAIRSLL